MAPISNIFNVWIVVKNINSEPGKNETASCSGFVIFYLIFSEVRLIANNRKDIFDKVLSLGSGSYKIPVSGCDPRTLLIENPIKAKLRIINNVSFFMI